jgi:glycosyltransferase involved in cell wall biosynthesis
MVDETFDMLPPLRVAVDARLNAYRVGGIPQYTTQLVKALAAQAPADQFVVLEHRTATRPLTLAPNIQHRRLWTPPHNRWEQWAFALELLSVGADVLHCPDFIPPKRRRIPAVITVHDLAFLHFPEILDDDAKDFYGQIGTAVRSADTIITVSQSTCRDLQAMLDVPVERINVVPEAASPSYRPLALEPGAERTINSVPLVAGTFALFVGTIEPRKNLETLLRALAQARGRVEEPLRLVLAGPRGWLDGPVYELIRDLKLGAHVSLIGGVDQQELRWLYNACRFYVQPELYSGFGLPVLEAMQCGAPVAVADNSALPELVGDAGLLVPTTDVECWSETLQRLWNDARLRAELCRRGIERARAYTWERAARETRAVYRRVAG